MFHAAVVGSTMGRGVVTSSGNPEKRWVPKNFDVGGAGMANDDMIKLYYQFVISKVS